MTVTAARSTMSPRRSAVRVAAVAALSAAALLGSGLMAQAAAPARTTGAAVELPPAVALATQCYYRVNATGGLVIRSGPGTGYTRVGSYPNGATVLASASTTNGFRNVGTNRWVSAAYLVRITSYPCE
ncbi:SH3 domain-containing protein [Streptomyces microflavus]|uniref:SH3 domain-containing protein n=1 Tax=Streptomyces microflavus TaxID=1919 RepID=A0A7H8MZT7_STRMI|nr:MULTISPECIES: SH3 domain-containing protein [Streptomyces]MBK3587868.1 SH3 domain-containing protein [Streptomyces sp. MBT57]MBK5995216.1 SH3 domain-containing protein [Streptomyces sp. MBT58]MBW3363020.1 SH3 domain-containing protein [Streptomyces sp. 09ZI22]QKW47735.1 SH3 domain-containing protein [Streptomyces microflavus]WSR89107.1 SH3 domain-containing protein [Streptomyces microflavus]